MEAEVVDIIENSFTSVKGCQEGSRRSRARAPRIDHAGVRAQDHVDVALQEVQSKISQAQLMLPKDIDPPVIMKFNPDDQPFNVDLVGRATGPSASSCRYVKDELKDKFTTLPGSGTSSWAATSRPSVRVWLDPEKMRAREITVDDVLAALRNEHVERPLANLSTRTRNGT